jgi:MerR family mercuric resistance operon transcriptional regulator
MASITASRARTLTIGALSHLAGVNIETIRYYERIDLMTKPPRTAGGHRSYQPEHIERLRFIRRARELGFGIANVRAFLMLASNGSKPCADVRAIAASHLEDVRARRNDLAKLQTILTKTIKHCDEQCCGTSMPPCPILEVLQR